VETYATNNSAFHTEKSLNTILYGHVPVVIGGEGSMKKLQDMGMIIPDYIQWSIWDDIPINELNYDKTQIMQRQMTALFSKHKIKDIAEDWYPYALRNFENFKNIKTTCLEEEKEICRWILTTTQNLSNREYQKLYQ
jgi:reverse gyrase